MRNGLVSIVDHMDDSSQGVRKLLHSLKDDGEVDATTVATVGTKGFDGFVYAVKV